MAPRTRYARCGDLNLAYQVKGEGPLDIVLVPSFVSNIEFSWAHPVVKAWLDRLASFARLIIFDKAGTGLSDHVDLRLSAADGSKAVEVVVAAVEMVDAVGFQQKRLGMDEARALRVAAAEQVDSAETADGKNRPEAPAIGR